MYITHSKHKYIEYVGTKSQAGNAVLPVLDMEVRQLTEG